VFRLLHTHFVYCDLIHNGDVASQNCVFLIHLIIYQHHVTVHNFCSSAKIKLQISNACTGNIHYGIIYLNYAYRSIDNYANTIKKRIMVRHNRMNKSNIMKNIKQCNNIQENVYKAELQINTTIWH